MSGGGKTSTSSSTATIPPDVLARYNSVNAVAQNVAQTPFQTYSSNPNAFVAPLNSTQQAGIANTNAYSGAAQPYYSAAGQNLMQGQQAAMPYYDTAGSYYGNAAQTGAAYAGASTNALQSAAGAAQPLQNAAAYNISNAPGAAQPYYDTAGQNLNQGLQTGSQLGQNSYNTLQGAQQTGAGLAGASYAGIQQALQTGAGLGQASYGTLQGANSNASPYLQAAAGYGLAGSQAINPTQLNAAAINQYMSPFLNNVYGATLAGENQQNAQQMSALQGNAIQAGAFGGDRAGIAAANMAYQQNLANAQTNANLLNTGYINALNTAGQQQALGLGAGQANRAALQQASNQMLGLGQQQFNQGATTAAQQAALGQQQYGQQANAAQQYAALGQQQFSQGSTAAQQQAALGQQMFGQAATAAQQQAAMGLGQANLMSTAGQQEAALGQQQFSQDAAIAAQLAALGQQQFGQGQASGAAAQGLGAGLYGMGASTAQQLANLGAGSQTAGLQGAQAQMAAGQTAQQTQQAGQTALYNQFLQQQAYPFQTTQFLANIAEGTGALSGGTTATTTPLGLLAARGGAINNRAQRYSGGLVNASMGGHVYPEHSGEGYAEGGYPAAEAPAAHAAPATGGLAGGGLGASSFFNTPTGNAVGQGMGVQGFAAAPQFPTASASWFNAAPTLSPPPKFPTASASGLGSFPAFSPQLIPQMQSFAPSQASMAKDFGLTDPAPFRDPVNTKMAPWQQIIADEAAAEAAAKTQAAGVGGASGAIAPSGTINEIGQGQGTANAQNAAMAGISAQSASGAPDISAQGFMNRGGRIHKAYAGAVSGATGPGGVDPLYLQAQMQMLQNSQNLPGAGLNLTGMPMSAAAAQPGIVPTTRNIMAGGPLPVSRSTIPPAPRMQAPTGLVGGIKELASDYRGLKDDYNTGSSALFGTKGTPAQGNTPAVDPSKGLFGNAGSSGGGYLQDWFAPQKARGGLIGRHHYDTGGYENVGNEVPTSLPIDTGSSKTPQELKATQNAVAHGGGGLGHDIMGAAGLVGAGKTLFGAANDLLGVFGLSTGGRAERADGGLVGRHGYAGGGTSDEQNDAPPPSRTIDQIIQSANADYNAAQPSDDQTVIDEEANRKPNSQTPVAGLAPPTVYNPTLSPWQKIHELSDSDLNFYDRINRQREFFKQKPSDAPEWLRDPSLPYTGQDVADEKARRLWMANQYPELQKIDISKPLPGDSFAGKGEPEKEAAAPSVTAAPTGGLVPQARENPREGMGVYRPAAAPAVAGQPGAPQQGGTAWDSTAVIRAQNTGPYAPVGLGGDGAAASSGGGSYTPPAAAPVAAPSGLVPDAKSTWGSQVANVLSPDASSEAPKGGSWIDRNRDLLDNISLIGGALSGMVGKRSVLGAIAGGVSGAGGASQAVQKAIADRAKTAAETTNIPFASQTQRMNAETQRISEGLKAMGMVGGFFEPHVDQYGNRTGNFIDKRDMSIHSAAEMMNMVAAAGQMLHPGLGALATTSPNGTPSAAAGAANTNRDYSNIQPPPEAYAPHVGKYAEQYGVPSNVANWVATHESGWDPNSTGNNVSGVWQFKPETYQRYANPALAGGKLDPTNPVQSTDAAMHYLSDLYKQTNSWEKAVENYGTFSTGMGAEQDALRRQGFVNMMTGNKPKSNQGIQQATSTTNFSDLAGKTVPELLKLRAEVSARSAQPLVNTDVVKRNLDAIDSVLEVKRPSHLAEVGREQAAWQDAYDAHNEAVNTLSTLKVQRNSLIDPVTGQPNVRTGYEAGRIQQVAMLLKQIGVPDEYIKDISGTNVNDAAVVEKIRTALGSQVAREAMRGTVRQNEWQRFQDSTPGLDMPTKASLFIIDNLLAPQAKANIDAYKAIEGKDPQNLEVRKTLAQFKRDNPFYSGNAIASNSGLPKATPGEKLFSHRQDPGGYYAERNGKMVKVQP